MTDEYGLCPICGAVCALRERKPDGNDTCIHGHTYPPRQAVQNFPLYIDDGGNLLPAGYPVQEGVKTVVIRTRDEWRLLRALRSLSGPAVPSGIGRTEAIYRLHVWAAPVGMTALEVRELAQKDLEGKMGKCHQKK